MVNVTQLATGNLHMNQQKPILSSLLNGEDTMQSSHTEPYPAKKGGVSFRSFLRNLYQRRMRQTIELYAADDLRKSALIVAPHPDDETLGCGGTILRKRQAGAEVTVLFMTDGSTSHMHLLPPQKLKKIRAQEAIAACKRLGVSEANVHFLEAPDGHLHTKLDSALEKLTELYATYRPAEIFVPYANDPNPDHIASAQAVDLLLQQQEEPVVCYEYPIWVWYHWPWIPMSQVKSPLLKMFIQTTLRQVIGLQMLHKFRVGIPVNDVLNKKWQALAEHRTQMTEFLPDQEWQTLHDVADQEWLSYFWQPYEIFRRKSQTL